MNNFYKILPEKVYKTSDVIDEALKPLVRGINSDYWQEIVSIISYHIQRDIQAAPLQINALKKLVPQADKYLNGLIKAGVIVREGRYIPGKLCYRYTIAPEYQSLFITLPLKNMKLIRRIEKVREKELQKCRREMKGRTEQIRFLKILEIDPAFQKYLAEEELSAEQYNSAIAAAFRIVNKDIFYKVDKTSGRFHSNVTNLPKGLRQFLRVNGEPLCNIDIKNSQPYLSTILLTNPGKASTFTENTAFALLLQNLKVSLNEDVKKYIKLVASGGLYEYLMQAFAEEGIVLTRQETKLQVLRILFARNRLPKNEINRACRLIFKKHFPTVQRIFNKIRGTEQGDKFQNYKRFAILLQRIESFLMLEVILKRIYRELPGVIAITIHDSIMTGILTNKVDAVRKIIEEELTFFVGISPKIKIEGFLTGRREKQDQEIILKQYDATISVNNCIYDN